MDLALKRQAIQISAPSGRGPETARPSLKSRSPPRPGGSLRDKMASMIISREEFASLTRPLIGIKVARAYQGYGSVVHMDLGRLRPAIGGRLDLKGEVSLMLEWDWRFETDSGIAFGSSSSHPDLATELAELEGQSVVAFSLEGRLPDLVVELSGGLRARSCSCREGDPRWGLWLPDSTWIHCEAGVLHYSRMGEGKAEELTEEERAEFDHAEATAERWGQRAVPDAPGSCDDCAYYVRLDGTGHFLDYGVCTSPRSIFDGRVVSFRSGCAAFVGCLDNQ